MLNKFYKAIPYQVLILLCLSNITLSAQERTFDAVNIHENSHGYISLETNVDSFYVVLNNDFDNYLKIANSDTFAVSEGTQNIRVVKKYYQDKNFRTKVEGGENKVITINLNPIQDLDKPQISLSSYPRLAWDASLVVKTDPEAVIYVNGNYAGTGMGRADVQGLTEIRSELPSGDFTTKVINVSKSSQAFYVEEFYNKPDKGKAHRLAFLPGASQIYQKEYFKGYAILGTAILGTAVAIKKQFNYKKQYDSYLSLVAAFSNYRDEDDPRQPEEIFPPVRALKNKADHSAKVRNTFIVVTLGAYVYSLIDGLTKPENGWRKTIEINPYFDFNRNRIKNTGISASYHF